MTTAIKVILADDDPILRRLLPLQLKKKDLHVETVTSGSELSVAFNEGDYDIVLLDVNLPDVSGIEILRRLRALPDAPEVIMLTADSTLKTGIEAMRLGAYEYLTKPTNPELLEAVIRKADEKRRLINQNARLQAVVRRQSESLRSAAPPTFQNSAMREIFRQAERVAQIDTTVLITGESGTGKDVLARFIHNAGQRAEQPLVAVNCGALPENLFESEFFGHEKGSFTGANNAKIGLVEAADNSTLFLDEIGEMPLTIQPKLLHFLENGMFRRVGATRDKRSDVRIIAATNRPLEEDVREGKFRADLFYRLNVVSFQLPPLRERREDILPLAEHFLERLRQKFNRPQMRLTENARQMLLSSDWRGNVRELRNTLERTAVLSPLDNIERIYGLNEEKQIAAPVGKNTDSFSSENFPTLAALEKAHIFKALELSANKREQAAKLLGITSRTLYRKLNEYNSDF